MPVTSYHWIQWGCEPKTLPKENQGHCRSQPWCRRSKASQKMMKARLDLVVPVMRRVTRFNHHGTSMSREFTVMGASPLTRRVPNGSLTPKNHHEVSAFQRKTANHT